MVPLRPLGSSRRMDDTTAATLDDPATPDTSNELLDDELLVEEKSIDGR